MPHLFYTRNDVALHNSSVMANISSENVSEIMAIDDISGEVNSSLREHILSKLPDDSSKTMGLQGKLTVGIGLQAEMERLRFGKD